MYGLSEIKYIYIMTYAEVNENEERAVIYTSSSLLGILYSYSSAIFLYAFYDCCDIQSRISVN